MAATYSKDVDGKLVKTEVLTREERITLKQLRAQKNQLKDDRDAFIAKSDAEIASWNAAIALVQEAIDQAVLLNLDENL